MIVTLKLLVTPMTLTVTTVTLTVTKMTAIVTKVAIRTVTTVTFNCDSASNIGSSNSVIASEISDSDSCSGIDMPMVIIMVKTTSMTIINKV